MRIADVWLLSSLLVLLGADEAATREHSGWVHRSGFEASLFAPKGSREMGWLKGAVPCEEPPSGIRAPGPSLFVEGRVRLSDRSWFGHLGRYGPDITRTNDLAPA